MNMNILRAKKIIEDAGMVLERGIEFNDPSNRPEFYDPYYNLDDDEPEYDYQEDKYEALCRHDEKHISEVISSNVKDRKFDVTASYDIDEEKIKYRVDISFYFDEATSQEERDRLESLAETALDGCKIEWDDVDTKLSKQRKKENVDRYCYDIIWYAYDKAKYKEPPERDYPSDDYGY